MPTDPPDVDTVEFAESTSKAVLYHAAQLRILTLRGVGASVETVREIIADEVAIAANAILGD